MQRKDPVHAAGRAAIIISPAVRRRRVAAVRNAMRRRKLQPLRRSTSRE